LKETRQNLCNIGVDFWWSQKSFKHIRFQKKNVLVSLEITYCSDWIKRVVLIVCGKRSSSFRKNRRNLCLFIRLYFRTTHMVLVYKQICTNSNDQKMKKFSKNTFFLERIQLSILQIFIHCKMQIRTQFFTSWELRIWSDVRIT